jgi:antitoxin MazE
MRMTTKVQKWGNSYAVRLPKAVVEELGLSSDTKVDIETTPKGIFIKPQKRIKFTLEELVAKITPENRHESIDWGPPRGKEIW